MKISVLLSIHNRLELFGRGLWSYQHQTLDRGEFEIIVIDDMSTIDLRPEMEKYKGILNIRHIRADHTKHRIFREMNPGHMNGGDAFAKWYHTPAWSINIGLRRARGEVILITQPEIILCPEALRLGYHFAHRGLQAVFGNAWQSSFEFVQWLRDQGEGWKSFYPDPLLGAPGARHKWFGPETFYWYILFVRREKALAIGGVDEEYCRAVMGEDNDFQKRLVFSGVPSVDGEGIWGIHQNHEWETEKHRIRDAEWHRLADTVNRPRYRRMLENKGPVVANAGHDWGSDSLVISEEKI